MYVRYYSTVHVDVMLMVALFSFVTTVTCSTVLFMGQIGREPRWGILLYSATDARSNLTARHIAILLTTGMSMAELSSGAVNGDVGGYKR